MYLLKRTDGNGYVSRPGSHESYTNDIDKLRIFETKEDAERTRCVENEIIIPMKPSIY